MCGSSFPAHNLTPSPIKFLCSYGGRILPRYTDGKLRYHSGETRVLSVDSSISFSELLVKMGEMCGSSVSLRCQLPTEDLDALVSITSDEDLSNLIEEYDHAAAAPSSSFKIRAFLYPKTVKKISPPPTASAFSSHASTPKLPFHFHSACGGMRPASPTSASRLPVYPIISQKVAGNFCRQFVYQCHSGQGNGRLIHKASSGNSRTSSGHSQKALIDFSNIPRV